MSVTKSSVPAGSVRAEQGTVERRRRGRALQAIEVVESAALVDVAVVICLVGRFLPLGWLLTVPAVVPPAVVALRWRLRAVVAGGLAGAAVAFLAGGLGLAVTIVTCCAVGALLGTSRRRCWGAARILAATIATLWAPAAALIVAGLALLGGLRQLMLAQIANTWAGASRLLGRLGLTGPVRLADAFVGWGLHHWWALVPTALLFNLLVTVAAAGLVGRPVLRRVALAAPPGRRRDTAPTGRVPRPLPVELHTVSYRYADAVEDAVREVSVTVDPAEFVAIVGQNGSGKSTLARILGGWTPTTGTVVRAGCSGPGRTGGTSLIVQRPDTQVLGVRVRDDVVWGLRRGDRVDVEALLAKVGLAGQGDQETSSLSGGQLQRLAMAAALARNPRLLISDESTAMVDAEGREQLADLLARLPAEEGVAVVHVTHRPEEVARADQRITLHGGRQVDGWAATSAPALVPDRPAAAVTPGAEIVRVDRAGHVYAEGTPWAHRALRGVSFTMGAGEAVLIRGRNGSGKSTLAWVLAGLLAPSEGAALLDGRPVDGATGRVGLAVQHARLQLLAPTVGADVRAAAGVDAAAADAALFAVGLEPAIYRDRRVEQLSGGEQRRAALAGMLARRPRLLVLDEPFAGLDERARSCLLDVLIRLRQRGEVCIAIISHDLEGIDRLVDRMLVLDRGGLTYDGPLADGPLADGPPPEGRLGPTRTESGPQARSAPRRRRRRRVEPALLRYVPGDSPVHRLWAGTKVLAVATVSVLLSARPSWPAIAAADGAIALAALVAHIPRGAARLPRWFWMGVLATGTLTLFSGAPPINHLGPVEVSFGGFVTWLRFSAVSLTLLAAAALVGWTTPLAELAPAVRTLSSPLRRLRLPVDEWVAALALSVRCLPLLADELRTLTAVRRLRMPADRAASRSASCRRRLHAIQDLLSTAVVVSIRRAQEMADAITARGGFGMIADRPARPGRRDLVAGAVAALVVTAAALAS